MKYLILLLLLTSLACGLPTSGVIAEPFPTATTVTKAIHVNTWFVCKTDPNYGLNVRAGTGTEFESIDVIPNDTPVTVTRTNTAGWVAVVYNGGGGYVNDNYICER